MKLHLLQRDLYQIYISIKQIEEFSDDKQKVLELIKKNSGKTIKELFDLFDEEISYRTFHRKSLL